MSQHHSPASAPTTVAIRRWAVFIGLMLLGLVIFAAGLWSAAHPEPRCAGPAMERPR
jgi:hypothetical protein